MRRNCGTNGKHLNALFQDVSTGDFRVRVLFDLRSAAGHTSEMQVQLASKLTNQ